MNGVPVPDALFDMALDWSRPTLVVREAPVSGRDWCAQWHYANVPPTASLFYGAFCPDLIAIVAVGFPAGNVNGLANKYDLNEWPGNLEITRVICHPDAPKNTASRCIAAVLRHVHAVRRVDWVFSYADTGQGHHGGIYQALNAVYLGVNGPARYGYRLAGVETHPKTVVNTFGTQAWPRVQQLAAGRGLTLERVTDLITPKHVYVVPCGTPAVNRAIRRHLEPSSLPYPKRGGTTVPDAA